MNWRAIWAIIRKDLRLVRQNKNVLASLMLMPALFFVIMPGIMVYLASSAPESMGAMDSDFGLFFANMPAGLRAELANYNGLAEQFTLLIAGYLFAPLFLMVPIMVSTTFGADSIAGEHERKTLEGLLYTPISDFDLYIAKLLVAWIPAVITTLIGGVFNVIVVNAAAWGLMGRIWFPNTAWLWMVLWLSPAVAALGLAAIIFVSRRAKTVQEAIQVSGFVVVPIILLLVAQMAGAVYFSTEMIALIGVIVWVVAAVMLWIGAKTFQRGELIARL